MMELSMPNVETSHSIYSYKCPLQNKFECGSTQCPRHLRGSGIR